MKFIDLFSGIGGIRLAFELEGFKCVFSSEIDKYARQTYEANFNDVPNGDIVNINANDIPNFDVIAAGFPCQSFSQAGHHKGFNDPRGTLINNVFHIMLSHKPKTFFLENVPGLLSHDKGNTFKVIKQSIKNLGYSFDYKILKACDYGLPTFRPRVYMVGFRNDLNITNFEWPMPIPLKFTMSDVLKVTCQKEIGYTIRAGGKGSGIDSRHNWNSYRIFSDVREGDRTTHIYPTLTTSDGNDKVKVNGTIRTLTVDEMKIMMGFPEYFKFPVSKTQAMKQIGNSVAIDVVREIAKSIRRIMQ